MIQAGSSSNTKHRKTSHRLLAALDLDSLSMASSAVRKMGVPLPDRLPGPYLPPTHKGLWKAMKRTVKNGGIFYQHQGLFGRGFSKKQVEAAIDYVMKAEKALFEGFETLSSAGQSPQTIKLILDMSDNKEFQKASEPSDNKVQMRIALEALTIKMRTEEIMLHDSSILHGAAERQAKEDVEQAQGLANEFDNLKRTPGKGGKEVHKLVARMNEMEWKETTKEFFEFDLAMDVIDEQRQPEMVEEEDIVGIPEPPAELQPPTKEISFSDMLKELMPHEKELVAGVLGKTKECNEDDLKLFVEMRPGIRDLFVRNFIASRWTKGDWKEDIEKYADARKSVYNICRLQEPTEEEKMQTVLQLRCLSLNQKHLIASALNVHVDDLTEKHVYDFRVWVSKDPEHLDHWKSGTIDLLTLGEMAHKMRFLSGWDYTPEEVALLSIIMDAARATTSDHNIATAVTLGQEDKAELSKALISPTVFDTENYGRNANVYRPQFQAISKFGDMMEIKSLRGTAQRQAEFHVLLDFLGVPVEKAAGKIDYSNCETRAKRKNGDYATNDDSVSSAVVTLADGSRITLDAVFDGMGGHASGYVASELAKDVFEVAAVAGWITNPEDVRRVFIIAHLAITMEQIRRLKRTRESEQYPENEKGYWIQENNMGTTAVVSFQRGREFYGIHCGDSDYIVIRDGKVVFQSVGHTLDNEMRAAGQEPGHNMSHIVTSALGAAAGKVHINNKVVDYEPFLVEGNDLEITASDGITVPICEHEFQIKVDERGGDLSMIRREIIELAESRAGGGPHPTLCECQERRGKTDDDKSLVIRYAKDG